MTTVGCKSVMRLRKGRVEGSLFTLPEKGRIPNDASRREQSRAWLCRSLDGRHRRPSGLAALNETRGDQHQPGADLGRIETRNS
jgi:hypothetical protein